MNFKIIFILITLLSTTQTVGAAPAEPSLTDTVPHLIALGFDEILKNLGDSAYSLAGANNSSELNLHMAQLLIQSNDQFLDNQFIQDQKNFNAFWFGVFYLLYVFIGAVLVWKHNSNPMPNMKNGFALYDEFLDSEKYAKTVVWGLIIFMFVYYGLDYVFKLEWLLSQGIALETFNILPPTADNAVAYLFGALTYLGLAAFFMFRYFVVGITSAFLLFMFGLYLFPYVRGIITEIFSYALLLLFSRFFLAAAMMAGMALIQALPFGLKYGLFPYLVLTLLVDILALVILLGPVTVLRWTKTGVKTLAVAV
jgi:hypothetical protein